MIFFCALLLSNNFLLCVRQCANDCRVPENAFRESFSFLGGADRVRGRGSRGSSWARGSFAVSVALLARSSYFGLVLLTI